jgi:hypothetical protein
MGFSPSRCKQVLAANLAILALAAKRSAAAQLLAGPLVFVF